MAPASLDIGGLYIDTNYDSQGVLMKLSLQALSEKADVPERSIRFYIQKGVLPRPHGGTRGAFYTEDHLAELLRIRQWQEAGLSLDAIADLLAAKQQVPVAPARAGAVEVRSHLIVADGLELQVAPERAGLTQAQLRQLFQAVRAAYAELVDNPASHPEKKKGA
jgi:DNA-binding transcriptional MerR regulator